MGQHCTSQHAMSRNVISKNVMSKKGDKCCKKYKEGKRCKSCPRKKGQ
jgi:hypothetical protein